MESVNLTSSNTKEMYMFNSIYSGTASRLVYREVYYICSMSYEGDVWSNKAELEKYYCHHNRGRNLDSKVCSDDCTISARNPNFDFPCDTARRRKSRSRIENGRKQSRSMYKQPVRSATNREYSRRMNERSERERRDLNRIETAIAAGGVWTARGEDWREWRGYRYPSSRASRRKLARPSPWGKISSKTLKKGGICHNTLKKDVLVQTHQTFMSIRCWTL